MPPENELIEPGPFVSAETSTGEPPASETPSVETPAVETPPTPIYKGIQKEFSTLEQLSAYTLELERTTLEQQARLSGFGGFQAPGAVQAAPSAQSTPAGSQFDPKRLGELFILDPTSAVEQITAHVRASVLGDVGAHTSRTEFFRSFYEANEDLVGCEDLVDAAVGKNAAAWAKIPTEQAAKLLAVDVRARAERIRTATAPRGTPLASKPAHALPAGGNSVPKAPAAPAAKATNFFQEFRAQQAKHKKRA